MSSTLAAKPSRKRSKEPAEGSAGSWDHDGVAGAAAGMPVFLQFKCAECEEQKRKAELGQAAQAPCPECHVGELGGSVQHKSCCGEHDSPASGMHVTAHEGIGGASQPVPYQDRIQWSFGRHDISRTRVAVGGAAAQSNERMGSLAYTAGDRIAFREQPDLKLSAHEATHVVQQRNGAKLAGGVGRPGDAYEQQADEVAEAVNRGKSAEPILDRSVPEESSGALPAVQHRLSSNATRMFEPSAAGSVAVVSTPGGKAGAAAPSKAGEQGGQSGENAGVAEKEDAAQGKQGGRSGQPAPAPASGPQSQGAGPASQAQAGAQPGSAAPAQPDDAAPQPAAAAPAPSAPAPAPAAAPGDGGAPAPAPAPGAAAPEGGGGATAPGAPTPGAPASGNCTPACYHEPSEQPPDDQKSDEKPANPQGGKSEEQTSEGDEEDAPGPDNCSTQQQDAGVSPAGEAGSAPTAAGGPPAAAAAPAAPGAAPAAGAGGATPATPQAPGAGPSATGGAGAGGGGAASAGSSAGGGAAAQAAAAAPLSAGPSPIEGSIAQSEGRRSAAVATYEASSKLLDASAANSADLRNGVDFAAPASGGSDQMARREAAAERADQFFSKAADGLEKAIAFASGEAPDRLGAQADAGKAHILASALAQKEATSARIAGAREEAMVDAAIARQAVIQQSDSFVEQVQSGSEAAILALTAAHAATMAQVDTLETSTLDQVNQTYSDGRAQLEGLGVTVGDECTAIGERFAATYETFEHCTENGFWDGDLSERRAQAQADAARNTAEGYHDSMVDKAKKRAREVVRNGRQNSRCQVITTASAVRGKLDETLDQLKTTIESSRDHAIEQANGTRDALLSGIDGGLASTLRQLDQQEHDQRQTVDDACYMQQVSLEQMAYSAAASVQGVVSQGASALHDSLYELRAKFASNQAPDPEALDTALSIASRKVDEALGDMQNGLLSGTAAAVQQLATALGAGMSALDNLAASNEQGVGAISGGFGSAMGAITGQDNFASQRAGFMQMMAQAITGGVSGFQQIFGAMKDGCDKVTADAEKSFQQASTGLEKNLRQSKQGIECKITTEADKAASQEAPAWKRLIAVLLIIVVIVIVIVVTVLTAGAGLGLLAVLAIGAVVGGVTSGLITMATNLWTNQSVTKGVGEAMLIGAATGLVGGVIGMGVGAVVGKVAGAALSVAAKEVVTVIVTTAIIDVGSQLIQGGFSFKNFSLKNLAIDLAVALVMHKVLGAVGEAAAAEGGAHAGPAATEPTVAPEAPPVTPEGAPAAPEAAPIAPEAAPAALEAAPAAPEVAPAAPEVAPTAPEGEAPTSPQEKEVLDRTATKDGDELSPEEARAERDIASRTEGEPVDDPPFTTQKELPNGHTVEETADGKLCKRCSPGCGVFDAQTGEPVAPEEVPGAPRRMGTVSAGPEGIVEHPVSTPDVEAAPARRGGMPPSEASATPEVPEPAREPAAPSSRTSEEISEEVAEDFAQRTDPEAEKADVAARLGERDQAFPRTSEQTTGPERARAAAEAEERAAAQGPADEESGSQLPDETREGNLFDEPGPETDPEQIRRRQKYLGSTPGKDSPTGRAVQARMLTADPPTLRVDEVTGKVEFQASDKQWYPIEEADMAHYPKDAVTYWNEEGRYYGEQSTEVREWMNDEDNYTLDHYKLNRSAGASLGEEYLPPASEEE
jgi:vacuolar-type H+-ATPase subunit H